MSFLPRGKFLSYVLVMLTAGSLTGALLTACGDDSLTGTDCAQYEYQDSSNPDTTHSGSFGLDLVLIDLYSNSAQTAASIAQSLEPYLAKAITNGAYVMVEADGGVGTPLVVSNCFNGHRPFLVTRANQTRQDKDRAAAANDLEAALKQFIQTKHVTEHGSATRLLQGASQEINAVRGTSPDPVGKVQVILWSNLLGSTNNSDCLSVTGMPGTEAYAQAIVKRCFSEGQLTQIPHASVQILGVGTGAVNRQQSLLADDLGTALCSELGSGCQTFEG